MKTLNENTNNFVNEVKSVLDNASWDFEACNPSGNYTDTEKACAYLETQKFSTKVVKQALEEIWTYIVYNIRDAKVKEEDRTGFAAAMIANELAFDRINRYQAVSRQDHLYTKKWYIDETVTFIIK